MHPALKFSAAVALCAALLPCGPAGAQTAPVSPTPGSSTAAAGETVAVVLTIVNTDAEPLTGATFREDLGDVLDDAEFDTVQADVGVATFTSPTLTWTGDLAPYQEATITFSVRVRNPSTGNHRLALASRSSSPGTSTGDGPGEILLTSFALTQSADKAEVHVGEDVTVTIVVTNTGATPIAAATVTDDLTGLLDDAAVTAVTADAGTVGFTAPTLSWTGDLAPGQQVGITYTATVKAPDPGDHAVTATLSTTTSGGPTTPLTTTTTVLRGLPVTGPSAPLGSAVIMLFLGAVLGWSQGLHRRPGRLAAQVHRGHHDNGGSSHDKTEIAPTSQQQTDVVGPRTERSSCRDRGCAVPEWRVQ